MAGLVLVNETRIEKPSELCPSGSVIRIKGDTPESRYVSRGGLKLEHALRTFSIEVSRKTCIDIGSSTGGFTDCLLQHGATRIVAIDVGTNQLAWKLRSDERVEVRENVNARSLQPSDFDTLFDLAVMDVSFISVTKIIPSLVELLVPGGKLVILIKPQFEVGRGEVGKGGIVKEPEKHERVIRKISEFANKFEIRPLGVTESPILGAKGNKEFLGYYERT